MRQYICLLSVALNHAVTGGEVVANPANGIQPPRIERRAPIVWTLEQVRHFLDITNDDPFGPLWPTLLDTGMWVREALALSVGDLDATVRTGTIQRTLTRDYSGALVIGATTTTGERRTVPFTPSAVMAPRGHVRRVTEQQLAAVVRQNHRLIFPTSGGRPHAVSVTRTPFHPATARVELPCIRVHALRHTNPTLLLKARAPVSAVSARLGHASVSMTLDLSRRSDEDARRGHGDR